MFQKSKKSFYQKTKRALNDKSYIQMFNILENSKNETIMNIWKNYTILYSEEFTCYFELYTVKDNDWWENISYDLYGTVDYWWIIALFNKIENPFEGLIPGANLYILRREYIYTILNDLLAIRDL